MSYALLNDRAVLALSGEDTRSFLQGLITNDMRKVTPSNTIFAALLSPQGKFLHDFFVIEDQGEILLETEKARLPDLKKRLMTYRLRSKVEFSEKPNLAVAAVWQEERDTINSAIYYTDPRLPALGKRLLYISPISLFPTNDNYHQHRISLGVPEGSKDLIVDRSLLLEYGYDELHAIDFAKGCYVGQEVTARSKHRATLRKFIHQVKAQQPLPPYGTVITSNDREIGSMASSEGMNGLAIMSTEEVTHAASAHTPLLCAGIALHAHLPLWCQTSFSKEAK